VANFIGQANFLTARVLSETGSAAKGETHYRVSVDGLGQFGAVGAPGLTGSTHELVIRPHRLRVSLHSVGTETIAGIIERVSYTGDAISVAVKAGNRVLQAQMPTSSGDLPRPGDSAYLSWNEQDAFLLPAPVEVPAA
jgi:putative spermidine/putrescine transport system ATP-binding protein